MMSTTIGAARPMNDLFAYLKENSVSAMLIAAITGLFGLIAARAQKAPDVQTSLNAGFDGIVTHTTALLEQARADASTLRAELERFKGLVDQYETSFEELNGFVMLMYADHQRMVAAMTAAGVPVPQLSTPPAGPNIVRPSTDGISAA